MLRPPLPRPCSTSPERGRSAAPPTSALPHLSAFPSAQTRSEILSVSTSTPTVQRHGSLATTSWVFVIVDAADKFPEGDMPISGRTQVSQSSLSRGLHRKMTACVVTTGTLRCSCIHTPASIYAGGAGRDRRQRSGAVSGRQRPWPSLRLWQARGGHMRGVHSRWRGLACRLLPPEFIGDFQPSKLGRPWTGDCCHGQISTPDAS
jgi:hypothetical protein